MFVVVMCLWLCVCDCVWLRACDCVCDCVFVVAVVVVCLWLCLWLCVCDDRGCKLTCRRMVVVEVRRGTLGANGRG